MQARNLFSGIPADLPQELTERLAGAGQVRIERILSKGQASPPGFWYDQSDNEWVMVVRGAARVRLQMPDGEQVVALAEGDFLDIPAGLRHRVDWTAQDLPTIWLAVFY